MSDGTNQSRPPECPPPECPPCPWPLRMIGIEPDPANRFKITFKPRFFGLIVGIFLWFLIGMTGLTVYSTYPSFCNSCHIMEPYYSAWKHSNHNQVSCIKCHFSPEESIVWLKFQALSQVVKYVTRTYSSKPVAQIDDASCLRSGCHSERLLKGRVLTSKGVMFDHTPHLKKPRLELSLRCVSCHSQIMVGTHMQVTWDSCYLCHLDTDGGKIRQSDCLQCHLAPLAPVTSGGVEVDHEELFLQGLDNCSDCHRSVATGQGEVSRYVCVQCHNQPENLARFEDKAFIHLNHVTRHNIACFHCHRPIEHKASIAPAETGRDNCATCHGSRHLPEERLYRGEAVAGVGPMPAAMLEAGVQCSGCHAPGGHTDKEGGMPRTACVQCHPEPYLRMNAAAIAEVTATAAALRPAVAAGAMGSAPAEAEQALAAATSANAAHNVFFAAALLRRAHETLRLSGNPTPAADTMPIITGQYCSTLCHSMAGRQIPGETVKFNGHDFPHDMHAAQNTCNDCHAFGPHKQASIKDTKVCAGCHGDSIPGLGEPKK